MNKLYSKSISLVFTLLLISAVGFASVRTLKVEVESVSIDSTYKSNKIRLDNSIRNKPVVEIKVPTDGVLKNPFRQGTTTTASRQVSDTDKQITDLKIFPNPTNGEINVSFNLKKESQVTIKVVDVLGNEVLTLLSQKINQGFQKNTFDLSSKLSGGFYFVRIMTGNESLTKRISVL